MTTLASFLMSIAGPLAFRVLTMLGVGTVTFTGITSGMQLLMAQATANWASVAGDVMQLASLAGIPQCLGIICGAMTSRVGIWAAVSATRWVVAK